MTGSRIQNGGLSVDHLATTNPTTTTPPPMTCSAPRQNHIHHTSVLATRRVEHQNPQTTTRHSGLLAIQRALFEPTSRRSLGLRDVPEWACSEVVAAALPRWHVVQARG